MSPKNLEDCIKKNKIKRIKAVITMHNGGNPTNSKSFFKLKQKYKFVLIEDACHSLGGKYNQSCALSRKCLFQDVLIDFLDTRLIFLFQLISIS